MSKHSFYKHCNNAVRLLSTMSPATDGMTHTDTQMSEHHQSHLALHEDTKNTKFIEELWQLHDAQNYLQIALKPKDSHNKY